MKFCGQGVIFLLTTVFSTKFTVVDNEDLPFFVSVYSISVPPGLIFLICPFPFVTPSVVPVHTSIYPSLSSAKSVNEYGSFLTVADFFASLPVSFSQINCIVSSTVVSTEFAP